MKWKLKAFLDAQSITPYALSAKLEGKLSRNAVYALCQKKPERVYLSSLDLVIKTLSQMTGVKVRLTDIMDSD